MEILVKNKSEHFHPHNVRDVMEAALHKAGYTMDVGSLSDGSGAWLQIIQQNEDNQVIVEFQFKEHHRNEITGVHVYSSPIKTIVDEENSKMLI